MSLIPALEAWPSPVLLVSVRPMSLALSAGAGAVRAAETGASSSPRPPACQKVRGGEAVLWRCEVHLWTPVSADKHSACKGVRTATSIRMRDRANARTGEGQGRDGLAISGPRRHSTIAADMAHLSL